MDHDRPPPNASAPSLGSLIYEVAGGSEVGLIGGTGIAVGVIGMGEGPMPTVGVGVGSGVGVGVARGVPAAVGLGAGANALGCVCPAGIIAPGAPLVVICGCGRAVEAIPG